MAVVSHVRAATVLGETYAFTMLTRLGSSNWYGIF